MTRQYRIVVFDLDGVITDYRSSWGYVHAHFGETNEANVRAYFQGDIDDHEFMRRDIAIWKSYKPDITIEDINDILDEIHLVPNALETFQKLREHDLKLAIVSGGLESLALKVNELSHFDYVYANGLTVEPTGRLGSDGILNVPLMKKEKIMLKILDELAIPASECVAVGDSKVDIGMLEHAGLGIAFCPEDDSLKAVADVTISEKDLLKILDHII